MKLLIVEDDVCAAHALRRGLREEGFVVDIAHDGHSGLDVASNGGCDLVILDVSLPDMDGWTVLQRLRGQTRSMPVVMLTARDAIEDRVKGLSLGADDYVTKPFAFSELTARIHAVLRRGEPRTSSLLEFEDLVLDTARSRATRGNRLLELTQREMRLLELLLTHKDMVLSRSYIAERVWDMSYDGDSKVVDVNVWRLRMKIDEPFERKLVHTVRGRGYVLR